MLILETYPKPFSCTEPLVLLCDEDASVHYTDPVLQDRIRIARLQSPACAKSEKTTFLLDTSSDQTLQILLVGLGKSATLDIDRIRNVLGKAIQALIQNHLAEATVVLPEFSGSSFSRADILQAAMEGACLGNYQFSLYKQPENPSLTRIRFWEQPDIVQTFPNLAEKTEIICQGAALARDWVNMPSNDKKPSRLAQQIAEQARAEAIETEILDEQWLQKMQFNTLLAVSAGSSEAPRLVILEYGKRYGTEITALIGKGVTFDSGGLNLKSGESMEDMKIDMAGAAAVSATILTAARLKLPIHLVGAIPLVENMPSGTSTRPGDIVHSHSGKTVEINNTDAEGRLILADTLSYVLKTYHPQICIDLATLTGACMVGLGERIAGLFSSDERLSQALIESGRRTAERCWPMPLPEDYREFLKTETADISNKSSSKWGGAITAALFLSAFVEDTRWAHIDIAGPAYSQKATPICPKGGTGFGVRLLIDYLIRA
ncbi:leucyl aminopeptidase [Desulfatirhabdium butyrativorans]|uniref:leucyl aminopeptidase n=1 Tax=Desulfatirhabdium butyrativorans TaxID=340467 RepID=UPI0003F4BC67|nr:leucyl aminopeptidase [Desulfatirhabdium butyrativorans]